MTAFMHEFPLRSKITTVLFCKTSQFRAGRYLAEDLRMPLARDAVILGTENQGCFPGARRLPENRGGGGGGGGGLDSICARRKTILTEVNFGYGSYCQPASCARVCGYRLRT